MINKFKEGRKYKFNKVLACRASGNWNIWVDWCHDKEVNVTSPLSGTIEIESPNGGIPMLFTIDPSWCIDVTDVK